jgi:hypothetical protein
LEYSMIRSLLDSVRRKMGSANPQNNESSNPRIPGSSNPHILESTVVVWVDGEAVHAVVGESLAAALYAAGRRTWRKSRSGEARGLLCGMGICFDCLVTVDHKPGRRACQVEVREGMVVETEFSGRGSL